MSPLLVIIVTTLMAGLAMTLGALLANIEKIQPKWLEEEFRHGIMAFGGGCLVSAVALVLVPEGIEAFTIISACSLFIAGGLSFMALDIFLKKLNTPASQLAAMLSDFIPESIALGAAFALGSNHAMLLALLITLQNLPEGFGAFRELKSSYSAKKIIVLFSLMALLGPISGVTGYLWFAQHPALVSGIMLYAAGGILYSIFQDIAPNVKLEQHWAPPMGAVLGFALGMAGFMVSA